MAIISGGALAVLIGAIIIDCSLVAVAFRDLRAVQKAALITHGGVMVSTGVWNKDKRAVAVIHVKSTR